MDLLRMNLGGIIFCKCKYIDHSNARFDRAFFMELTQPKMIFREAKIDDIKQIQIVRHSVNENTLSNSEIITDRDVEEFIAVRGKGWVCEIDKQIAGFAIADLKDNNIWALFLRPEFEKQGIGKQLHEIMLDWYFTQTKDRVWLGTSPNTRAESFYRKSGWTETGKHGKGEIKFEMTYMDWLHNKKG